MGKISTDDCWIYAKNLNGKGYGKIHCLVFGNRKKIYVHRLMYENFVGEIPEGLEIDHLCNTTTCINPEHLEAVTHAENVRRGNAGIHNKIKTHCPQGHEYNKSNTYIFKPNPYNTKRSCKECHRKVLSHATYS